jgi:hypothetical protein
VNDNGGDEELETGVSNIDFKWEGMSDHRKHRELFTGRFISQGATKNMNDILVTFQ